MLGLIALLQKVQVVVEGVRLVCCQLDLHVEFTPSFFFDPERRVLDGCITKQGSVDISSQADQTEIDPAKRDDSEAYIA